MGKTRGILFTILLLVSTTSYGQRFYILSTTPSSSLTKNIDTEVRNELLVRSYQRNLMIYSGELTGQVNTATAATPQNKRQATCRENKPYNFMDNMPTLKSYTQPLIYENRYKSNESGRVSERTN